MTAGTSERDGAGPPYAEATDRSVPVASGMRWECVRCGLCCTEGMGPGWLNCLLRTHDVQVRDGVCPRFDRTRRMCTDYDRRFNACQGFPLTLKRRPDDSYALHVHSRCPGIGHGPVVDIPAQVARLLALAEAEFGLRYRVEWVSEDPADGVILVLIAH